MLIATAMDLRALAHWTSRHLDSLDHERRVSRIATTLFDLTRDLHRLGPASRNLLRAAALVHDVGRSVDKPDHPLHGARMLLRDRALPVGDPARRALAYLTLYHRDDVPEPGQESVLRPWDDADALRKTLALLRTADALDSRSLESPRLVLGLKKRRLTVTCYLADPTPKVRRAYLRRKKFRLLEAELGLSIDINIRSAQALSLVA
jgi:exopolyphosphatase/pppGpp-phosphohydrolase